MKRRRKLSDDQVRLIRSSKANAKILAARYGVRRSQIYRVRNRTRKQSVLDVTVNLGGPAEPIGDMKPVNTIANLHKEIDRVERMVAAGKIAPELATFELSWMRAVIEHSKREVVRRAHEPRPSATVFESVSRLLGDSSKR